MEIYGSFPVGIVCDFETILIIYYNGKWENMGAWRRELSEYSVCSTGNNWGGEWGGVGDGKFWEWEEMGNEGRGRCRPAKNFCCYNMEKISQTQKIFAPPLSSLFP